MAKTLLAPIIATVFIFIKLVFGIDVPEDVISQIVDVVASVVAVIAVLVGIFQNHEKRPDAQETSIEKENPLD